MQSSASLRDVFESWLVLHNKPQPPLPWPYRSPCSKSATSCPERNQRGQRPTCSVPEKVWRSMQGARAAAKLSPHSTTHVQPLAGPLKSCVPPDLSFFIYEKWAWTTVISLPQYPLFLAPQDRKTSCAKRELSDPQPPKQPFLDPATLRSPRMVRNPVLPGH